MTNKANRSTLPSLASLFHLQLTRQFKSLVHGPRALIAAFLLPILLLLVRRVTDESVTEALNTLGGVAIYGIIQTCYITHAVGLVAARESGVLKRLRGTPLPPTVYFAGRITATVALATLAATSTIILASLLGVHLAVYVIPSVLIAVLLGSAAWAAIGTAAAAVIPDTTTAQAFLFATMLPVIFFSGVIFTTNGEPHWLATIASWLPAQPVGDMLTRALRITNSWYLTFPLHDILVLLGWTILGGGVALRSFQWEPYQSRPHRHHRKTYEE